ncbi:MAG: hypothetical protein AB7G20_12160 [Sulfurimonas sp.]|uniref:EF-hand domain-containing protein n=1 Tax=Sulfurimonas sp. TaxID=2022749 RepID=UPI003D12BE17
MKKFTKFIGLSFVAAMLSVSSLYAAEIPDRGSIPFEAFDINKDGFITEDEHTKVREERIKEKQSQNQRMMRNVGNAPDFKSLDADGDGKVSKMELLEGQNKQMQENRANKGPRSN